MTTTWPRVSAKKLDISDIFAVAMALPRQTAAEAELATEPDGDNGADACDFHETSEITSPQCQPIC